MLWRNICCQICRVHECKKFCRLYKWIIVQVAFLFMKCDRVINNCHADRLSSFTICACFFFVFVFPLHFAPFSIFISQMFHPGNCLDTLLWLGIRHFYRIIHLKNSIGSILNIFHHIFCSLHWNRIFFSSFFFFQCDASIMFECDEYFGCHRKDSFSVGWKATIIKILRVTMANSRTDVFLLLNNVNKIVLKRFILSASSLSWLLIRFPLLQPINSFH